MNRKLTQQESKFVAEYLKHGNGAEAALAAGITSKAGRKGASNNAAYMLKDTAVRAAIATAQQKIMSNNIDDAIDYKKMILDKMTEIINTQEATHRDIINAAKLISSICQDCQVSKHVEVEHRDDGPGTVIAMLRELQEQRGVKQLRGDVEVEAVYVEQVQPAQKV